MTYHSNLINILKNAPSHIDLAYNIAAEIAANIEDGHEEALEILRGLKCLTQLIDITTEQIESAAIAQFQREGQKSLTVNKAKFEMRELGVKWIYDKTGDLELTAIQAIKKKIVDKEKDRQQFLKSLKDKTVVLNEETGELVTIYPAYKESKTGLVVTLEKY
jgi:hypothetical protein